MKEESHQEEFIEYNAYSEHYLSNTEEFMTSITAEMTAAVLKTVHLDSFSSESLKAKMFII